VEAEGGEGGGLLREPVAGATSSERGASGTRETAAGRDALRGSQGGRLCGAACK
jgi:hypothetical protein